MALDDATLQYLSDAGNLLRQRMPLGDEQKAWLDKIQRDYPQFFAVPATSEAARTAAAANPMVPLDHHAVPLKDAYAKELTNKIATNLPLTNNEKGWFAVASGQLDTVRDSAAASDASRGAPSTASGPVVSQLSLPTDQGALTPTRRALVQTDMEREFSRAQDESSVASARPSQRYASTAVQQQQQQHQSYVSPPPGQSQHRPYQQSSNRLLHEPDSPSPAATRKNRRAFSRPVAAQQQQPHVAATPSQWQSLSPSALPSIPPPPRANSPRPFPNMLPPPPPPNTTPAVGSTMQATPIAGPPSGPSSSDELIRMYEEYSREHEELRPKVARYTELEGLLRELEFKLYVGMIDKDGGGGDGV